MFYVYFIQAGKKGAIKIGVAKNIDRRLAALQTGNPYTLHVLLHIKCSSKVAAYSTEAALHDMFKKQRIKGEWFARNIRLKRLDKMNLDVSWEKGLIDC